MRSSRLRVLSPLLGKSSASVAPAIGNERRPGESLSPNSLSTIRNEPSPRSGVSVSNLRTVSGALEMGGKNICVVLDDCAVRQAVHEVSVGAVVENDADVL